MDAFNYSSLTKDVNLWSSYTERYYYFEFDGNPLIVASETGTGYINKGKYSYSINFYPLYGDFEKLNSFNKNLYSLQYLP